jgi:hypothetical protein
LAKKWFKDEACFNRAVSAEILHEVEKSNELIIKSVGNDLKGHSYDLLQA